MTHHDGPLSASAADMQQSAQSASCSRARAGQRSGSTAPALGGAPGLPAASRSSSPSRLRSRPSVGVSTVDALSDAAPRAAEAAVAAGDHEGQEQLLEEWDRSKEAVLPPPRSIATCRFAEEPLIESGISDYTFIPKEQGGLLGRGKFSSVQLAWKHGTKYAVKITPLYPHHNLIATRLLREPTILAQLPPHPNLVKVYESIRTPGHFYLVEEYLDGYTNLESFVSSQPESRLTSAQSLHIFHQLVSVVRSALHEPIQIAHRDIKPENILIHPITLRIILLDFGLATHFSAREARLTTCCGSPAFHAPELVKSLKSPPGSVRYWGPDIDIWTIGVTLLRCISGVKYPLGVQHTSLQHLEDKTIDAVLAVKDKDVKRLLAGLLDLNGEKRMEFFRDLPSEIDQIPYKTLDSEEQHEYASGQNQPLNNTNNSAPNMNGFNRHFKNTTFIETQPKHSLSLVLASPPNSAAQSGILDLNHAYQEPGGRPLSSYLRSRSRSIDKLTSFAGGLELSVVNERLSALNPSLNPSSTINGSSNSPETVLSGGLTPAGNSTPSTPEIILLNPQREPAMRAISYVKYALRCAGILYHCQSPSKENSDLSQDRPSLKAPRENLCYPILHCVRLVSAKEMEKTSINNSSPAASALLNQFRPPLTRAVTMGAVAAAAVSRSVSQPPSRAGVVNKPSSKNGKGSDETVRCAEFWVQIIPVFLAEMGTETNVVTHRDMVTSQKRRPKSRSRGISSSNIHKHRHQCEDSRRCTRLRIRVSDESQLETLKKALGYTSTEAMDNYAMYATPPPRRAIPLPGRKASNATTSGEDTEYSAEERAEAEKERGRTKLSRSKSNEKSRSRSRTGTGRVPAHTASIKHTGMNGYFVPASGREAEDGDGTPQPLQIIVGQQESKPRMNGLLLAKLDSEEEARLVSQDSSSSTTKRGFFDFVNAFNMRTRPPPTGIATAPSTPAAIPEELEPQ